MLGAWLEALQLRLWHFQRHTSDTNRKRCNTLVSVTLLLLEDIIDPGIQRGTRRKTSRLLTQLVR